MSFNEDQKRGLVGTVIFHLALMLFFIFYGLTVLDPKPEEGISIQFGNFEPGAGETAPASTTPPPTPPTPAAEEVVTQDAPSDVVEESTEPTPETPVETEPEVVEEEPQQPEEPQPDQTLNNALDQLFSQTGGQGNSEGSGDEGDPTGDPNSPNMDGMGSGNGDYSLGNRGALSRPKPKTDCPESGVVVVKIWVNRQGVVQRVEPEFKGTTNASTCLFKRAKEAAIRTTWQGDPTAPELQIGTITYRFTEQ